MPSPVFTGILCPLALLRTEPKPSGSDLGPALGVAFGEKWPATGFVLAIGIRAPCDNVVVDARADRVIERNHVDGTESGCWGLTSI